MMFSDPNFQKNPQGFAQSALLRASFWNTYPLLSSMAGYAQDYAANLSDYEIYRMKSYYISEGKWKTIRGNIQNKTVKFKKMSKHFGTSLNHHFRREKVRRKKRYGSLQIIFAKNLVL